MKKTLTLICAAMLGAAGVLGVQAQTNTAIMLRSGTNGTSLVPTNAAGVISNALGLGPLATMTNTNTPLFVGTNAGATRTNLDLRWAGLTNTNAEGFRNSLGLGDNDVPNFSGLNIGDGADISPAGFWGNEFGGTLSFEEGRLEFFINSSNRFGLTVGGLYFSNNPTAQANTRTNLGLGASWLTNSNVPTPYSGAAVAGALLTADGAGGSAFSGTVPSISVIGDGDPWLIVTNNIPKMRTLVTFRGGSTANITVRVGSSFNDATGGNKVNGIEFYGDSGSSLGAIGYVSQRTFAIKAGTNAQTLRVYADETVNNNRFLEASMGSSGTAVIRPYGEGTNSNGNVLHISGLPTNNPGVGILWNSNGAVMVGY